MNRNVFPVLTEEEQRLPVYIRSVGSWNHQDAMLRERGYPDFQWLQCLDGEGCLEVGGNRYTVRKGQGMLLYPYERHHYYPTQAPWEMMWVTFNGSNAATLLATLAWTGSQVLYVSHPDLLLKKMHTAFTLLQSDDPLRGFECSSLLYDLLLSLYTYASPSEVRTRQQHYEQLAPVLAYIEERFDRPLSLTELAGVLQLSTQYTCRLFQQTLGMRPFEYIKRVRVRKAKELLLLEPGLDVQAVAGRVGYDHPSYFIKLFKQQEGVTPSTFRGIHRTIT